MHIPPWYWFRHVDGGLRHSDVTTLTWCDVQLWVDRTVRITIKRPKNQPEPTTVAVTVATARALRDIRPDSIEPVALVIELTDEALANRVRAAGLGDEFTGHIGRIDMVREMMAAGIPNAAVQCQGGESTVTWCPVHP